MDKAPLDIPTPEFELNIDHSGDQSRLNEYLASVVESATNGATNQTFLLDSGQFLHISRIPELSTKLEREALQRFHPHNKGLLTAHIQSMVPKHDRVTVPTVTDYGSCSESDIRLDFWLEKALPGELLVNKTESLTINDFETLIDWLSLLHSTIEYPVSLKDYYSRRLDVLMQTIEENYHSGVVKEDFALRASVIIEHLKSSIPEAVGSNEKVRLVHGDFRPNNILGIDSTAEEREFGIIDFEQGLLGGDSFTDLSKILQLDHVFRPREFQPYIYFPPLTSPEKLQLLEDYLLSSDNATSEFNLERRQDLCFLEGALSTMVLRMIEYRYGILETNFDHEFLLNFTEEIYMKAVK